MICKFGRFFLLLAFGSKLVLPLQAAEISTDAAKPAVTTATNAAPALLKPGPDAGKIAFVTAYMLEKLEYLQHPFDATMSARLFDSYMTSLDPQHLHFLQSDVTEFGGFRTNLDRMTLKRSGVAETQPAYEIFYRYMDRLRAHVAYVDELLKTEKFDFTTDERITLNRHELPYPKNIDEAKKIWRDRLRYEYLMEKVSRETQKTNTTAATSSTNGIVTATATNHVEKPTPPKSMHDAIVETLGKSYHRTLKVFEEWDSADVLGDYLEWLARSYDPHSDYQPPADYEDFAMQMNLSLFGIGAELRSEDGYCTIEMLLNGPAKLSKQIKVNDRIVAVAQSNQPPVDIFEMPITKAVRLIRGPKGTEVRLTVVPAGAPDSTRQVVTLIRDEIKLENGEAKGKIFEVPAAKDAATTTRLGVIDLPSFYATIDPKGDPTPKSTTDDVAALLKKFKEEKVAGVVLDLRRNGGGSLEEAIRLAGLFIKEGPIVQIKHANGDIEVREDTDPSIAYDGPLIVLTSRFSASASEIVAGALQDYGRALIVGDVSTFGKGTAQQVFYLNKISALSDLTHDPGTLKLTNSKFYRASGASTELRGVAADIVLPSVWNDSTEVGESTLDNHFPWDVIDSSSYDKVNMVQPALAELSKHSSERIATNKEFAYLRQDIERVQKQREDKTVSLNEKQQLADRAQIVAEHKAREEERTARKLADPIIYDLTVALSGKPGLPPPSKHTNDLSGAEGDATAETPHPPVNERDEYIEALTSESDHAETARLQEAKNILSDYIAFMKETAAKQTAPLTAK